MLVIREDQMAALRADASLRFRKEVYAIIARRFPEFCEALGRCEVTRQVDQAINAAAAKGVVSRANICKFSVLYVVFGADSAQDEAFRLRGALSREHLSDEEVYELYEAIIGAS